ncbi:predicted protein [Naegleria gruberi]|uniref:Predicted protein n=1 Tax=Naegleria gruberi TaxID=5762 RepID=D2V771_NAEGR|nr:uncharacterized protein NAEGRDRAFT_64692 [Naegleria gruberi]EFC47323.1 predicted protein [Naegleria gruberi]|eukprot:XP_002680067.1 predicted protein [Naegleria gruberi strain NEG-M]
MNGRILTSSASSVAASASSSGGGSASSVMITNHEELYSTFCCDIYDFSDDQLVNNNRSDRGESKNTSLQNTRTIVTTPFTLRCLPLEVISLGDLIEFPSS